MADRQVAANLDGIRKDHVERYRYAVERIKAPAVVLDAACGVGYGARMLAEAGNEVIAVDIEPRAIQHAIAHFDHDGVTRWIAGDLMLAPWKPQEFDAVVCLEALEHFKQPGQALAAFAFALFRRQGMLICSVPNEAVYKFDAATFKDDAYPHQRHYTPEEFDSLLSLAGFAPIHRGTQADNQAPVTDGTDGRYLVYTCALNIDPWLQTR